MIPKITQKGPSIMEQYWCGKCGAGIPSPQPFRGDVPKGNWRFCPICGEPIEYDKAVPVQWAEQSCERCGCKLIMEVQSTPRPYFIASSDYVGAPICRSCLEEHCVQTNCLQCEIGKWPDCPYDWVKKCALKNDNDIETLDSVYWKLLDVYLTLKFPSRFMRYAHFAKGSISKSK